MPNPTGFVARTNRRILPPNCVAQNNSQAHVNPISSTLSSSPLLVSVQEYQNEDATPTESNYVAAGISEGVTSSQFSTIQALEAVTVLNWNGFLRIQINDTHTLSVGNVLTIDQLSNVPYAVVAVIDSADFVLSAPYSANAVNGEFFYRLADGTITNNNTELNTGRKGGIRPHQKHLVRLPVGDNKASSIRQGRYNQYSGVFTQTINYTTAIASGVKAGVLGFGDTSTGGNYQRLGSGYMTMNIIGHSGHITTYQLEKKN